MRLKALCLILILLLSILPGCAKAPAEVPETTPEVPAAAAETKADVPEEPAGDTLEGYLDAVVLKAEGLEQEAVIMEEAMEAAIPDILEPVASGELVEESEFAVVDYSNTKDGYVMVNFTADTGKRLKLRIVGPKTTYTYNLPKGEWTVFPLTDGNGNYQMKVYENISGNSYSLLMGTQFSVELADEFAPFIRPNQYVNYTSSSKTVEMAAELTSGITLPLEKVDVIYNYVVSNLTYDTEKAKTVKSGYLPVLDTVLDEKKGICFDYAALMTGMLRSQGIPCKMIFGYAGSAYHAWISVWTEDTGWVDGVVYFDGTTWQRLDPTFASSSNRSEEITRFIGNGTNYKEKYLY